MAQGIKNRLPMQETQEIWVQSLYQEDPLEEEMATHSSILAWKIPWKEEPCRLQSMGSQKSWTWQQLVIVQSSSCVWLFATPWTAARQASLSFPISQSLLKFMFIKLVMLSNYLILSPSSPFAFNLSQHQGLIQGVGSSHQVDKVLELQL